MRICSNHCKFVSIYADSLFMKSKSPQSIIQTLLDNYALKLNSTSTINCHPEISSETVIESCIMFSESALKR